MSLWHSVWQDVFQKLFQILEASATMEGSEMYELIRFTKKAVNCVEWEVKLDLYFIFRGRLNTSSELTQSQAL